MTAGGAPFVDLYSINDNVCLSSGAKIDAPYTSLTGKSSVSGAITVGEKTGIFIAAGQSLTGNHGQTLYTPSNSKAHQLNIYDGVCYGLKDPVLGATGTSGTWVSRLADKLINAGTFTRVIMIPISIAGSPIVDHSTTGMLNQRIRVAYLRARGLGWLSNADARFGILWGQGETDTSNATSQASYQASWTKLQGSIDGLGYTGLWFVARESWISGAGSANVQAAQAAVVDNVRVFAGADTDSLTGANRIGDNTHLSDTGNDANATLWATVLAAHY